MTNQRRRRPAPRRRSGLAVGAALAALSLCAVPAVAQDFDEHETRSFAIPLARHARTRAEDAREHLEAGRWSAALAELQELVEEGGGDVLPDSWRSAPLEESLYPAYPGAAEWARRALRELPAEARALYRERFDAAALSAFEDARGRGERRPLVAVAARWPLSRAAELAWWTLGDLELERGHPEDALFAWGRAAELKALFGEELPPGAGTRLEFARRLLEQQRATQAVGFRGDDTGAAGARPPVSRSIPSIDSDSWSLPLDFSPFDGGRNRWNNHNLVPTLAGDRVLVNTSLRVFAVDGFTGRILWNWGPPEGWDWIRNSDEYFQNIPVKEITLRPAARSGVVVAAMQIPYTETGNVDWQQIDILYRIPERRLYAFDLETGEELWNHCPKLERVEVKSNPQLNHFVIAADEDEYARRMLVAASPIIVGARVLVPCYRLQGRIDYHVACYELVTGELLWSTGLISGQRERNMFGRPDSEFVASPLTVAGDVVVAQTELGAMAALDLMTGDILWEAEYDQMALRPNHSSAARSRATVWQVAPPHVVDGVVVATPSDSEDLIAFELADGRVLWDRRSRYLPIEDRSSSRTGLYQLVGVDSDTVYLAGRKLAAIQKPGGFRTRSPFRSRWTEDLYDRVSTRRPAPLVLGDFVVVPHEDERLVLDRWTGERRNSLSGSWSQQEYGNAVVGDGVLFTLGQRQLNGFFDWEVLLRRQRALLTANPGDPRTVLETSALFVRRAKALRAAGDTVRARDVMQEAKDLLGPLLADAGGAEAAVARGAREVADAVHDLYRLEARILVDLADSPGALRALATARPLASSLSALRDTLLQEERILRSGPPRQRLGILAELEASCATLPISEELRAGGSAWLIGEAILADEAVRGWEGAEIDIGLWVLLTRADARARQRDGAGALQDLHAALAGYGDVGLNDTLRVGDVVSERIARRIELDGRASYREFERDAANLLARAKAGEDRHLFEDVVRLYPHSDAARDANRALLERAYLDGAATDVAQMVYGSAQGLHLSEEDRALGLLQLGIVLAREGNRDFLAGLVATLGAALPALRQGLDDEGRARLDFLAEQEDPAATASPTPVPQFTHDVGFTPLGHHEDQHDFIGPLVRTGEAATSDLLHVYLRRKKTLTGYASSDPTQKAWSFETPFGTDSAKCAVGRERVFVGSNDMIFALDEDGTVVWTQEREDEKVLCVETHGGVVVVEVGNINRPRRVVAYDTHAGTPLWEMPIRISNPVAWRHPLLGDGHAVFLVKPHVGNARAIVVDIFSGRVETEIELDRINTSLVEEGAWIQNGRLAVPSFRDYAGQKPYLAVHDLATGQRDWLVTFDDGEEFHSIAAFGDKNYLVTRNSSLGRRGTSAGIYEIDLEHLARRRVATLDVGEEVIGLKEGVRTELLSPYLFVYPTSHSGNTTPIRAMHLPNGRRWVYHLPVGDDELYDGNMPLPAVSDDCVAFAYVLRNPSNRLPQRAMLEFVDLTGGFRLDSRTLIQRLAGAERIELRGLENSLFILRKEGSRSTRGLDVLVSDQEEDR